ncbi:MAG: hypothetical protein KME10_10975 [Plectolyngbya sp. WJT66-NPBG17]|jgi:hypothetical protein|nr:hypothetical protein [Plectolyngbya sp. WJT66-NPBG17]MBW4524995.1 hypothetical protein [Phormidium tanganyikae FI6-MK23]
MSSIFIKAIPLLIGLLVTTACQNSSGVSQSSAAIVSTSSVQAAPETQSNPSIAVVPKGDLSIDLEKEWI